MNCKQNDRNDRPLEPEHHIEQKTQQKAAIMSCPAHKAPPFLLYYIRQEDGKQVGFTQYFKKGLFFFIFSVYNMH